MANSSKTPVQSIDRVLDLIETLSSASHGMTLTDLSASVGLHVSTTHRLLSSLVSRGYVQKDGETGKYRLTLRMFEIGSRVLDGLNLVSIARPHLEYLADLTRETIHLVARSDGFCGGTVCAYVLHCCREMHLGLSLARGSPACLGQHSNYCLYPQDLYIEGRAVGDA